MMSRLAGIGAGALGLLAMANSGEVREVAFMAAVLTSLWQICLTIEEKKLDMRVVVDPGAQVSIREDGEAR